MSEVQIVEVRLPPVDEDDDDSVEVIDHPPDPPLLRLEGCPVPKDLECPLCLNTISDGTRIVVLGCDNRHILCSHCYNNMTAHDVEHQRSSEAPNLAEAVRRHEGADKCPTCRGTSPCSIEAVAMVFEANINL